jgi:beta-glucanase (GH16 family)
MKIVKVIFYLLFLVIEISCKTDTQEPAVVVPPVVYKPVVYSFEKTPFWADEFDTDGLPNAKNWGYDVGGSGWGNNELQYYTKEEQKNARVEKGNLIIEALKEDYGSKSYTSARLVTKNKSDFLYGKFEIKAKLPKGRGTWPAIWMLATDQSYGSQYWPDNGEIDIMEHVGFDQNNIHTTIHTKDFNHGIGTQKSAMRNVPLVSEEFHIYRMEWTPAKIEFFIDDVINYSFPNTGSGWSAWPFDKKQHLLLNIAVGGNWGGQKGIDDSIFPQKMWIDYVRVYKMVQE